MGSYAPRESPVPPVPTEQVFSEIQWKTLLSLADTVIPAIRTSEEAKPSDKAVPAANLNVAVSALASSIRGPDSVQIATKYLEESASDNPLFREALQRLFATYVHQEGRNGLGFILNALKYFCLLINENVANRSPARERVRSSSQVQ